MGQYHGRKPNLLRIPWHGNCMQLYFTIHMYVCNIISHNPHISSYILPLSFLYLWIDIPLSNIFVTSVLAYILILLPICWHFCQIGFHQGQHISHNSNTSHMLKYLSSGNQQLKTPSHMYFINQRIEMNAYACSILTTTCKSIVYLFV